MTECFSGANEEIRKFPEILLGRSVTWPTQTYCKRFSTNSKTCAWSGGENSHGFSTEKNIKETKDSRLSIYKSVDGITKNCDFLMISRNVYILIMDFWKFFKCS